MVCLGYFLQQFLQSISLAIELGIELAGYTGVDPEVNLSGFYEDI